MRQLFNWRFVAAVAALAVLALLARGLLLDDEDAIGVVIDTEEIERHIDLIEPIATADWTEEFQVGRDGATSGFIDLTLDTERVMRIAPGTLGEISCRELDVADACAVFADMLGDAVIWFAIVPQAARATAELPPIVDLDEGDAILENGWRIPYPPVIERDCEGEDIPTFSDFLRRFGPGSVSIVDLESRQVVAVRCGEPVDD